MPNTATTIRTIRDMLGSDTAPLPRRTLALILNCTESAIYRWETGSRTPSYLERVGIHTLVTPHLTPEQRSAIASLTEE